MDPLTHAAYTLFLYYGGHTKVIHYAGKTATAAKAKAEALAERYNAHWRLKRGGTTVASGDPEPYSLTNVPAGTVGAAIVGLAAITGIAVLVFAVTEATNTATTSTTA